MMNKCKEQIGVCPETKIICCHDCEIKDTCGSKCELSISECNCAEEITDEVALIESVYPDIIRQMKNFIVQKKIMDAQEQDFKTKLKEAMEKFNIKKIDNDFFAVTYVDETTRTSLDSTKLKKDHPDIAEKYQKVSKVSSSVRLKVK